jgi:predicted HicB family RNase H-like nuclease
MLKSKDTSKLRDEVKQISEALAAKTAKTGKVTVSMRLSPEVHKKIKVAGAQTGRTASELMETAVEKYLKELNI